MNLKFESIGRIKDFPVSDIVGEYIVFKHDLEAKINDMFHRISYLDSELVFGYVFPLKEKGLYVAKLGTGFLDENNVVKMHHVSPQSEIKLFPQEREGITVKVSDVEDCEFIFTDNLSSDLKEKYYNTLPFIKNSRMEEICKNKSLDQFRDDNNPFVIHVDGEKLKLENSGSYGLVGKFLDNADNDRVLLDVKDGEIVIDRNFSSTENGQIILEIRSKLTDSKPYNRKYLKGKFLEHGHIPEVLDVIFEKYSQQLEGEDKAIFSSRVRKHNDKILDFCEEAIETSKFDDSKKALCLIEDYISNYSCSEDYLMDYFEKDIFIHFLDDQFFIARQDLSNLYRAYGVILNDNSQNSAALEAFKKAYYLNPVNVDNLVELALYYLDVDLDKCLKTLDLGFKYSYSKQHFNELYHILEEYYIKTGDDNKASAVASALDEDYDKAIEMGIPVDYNEEILKLLLGKLKTHVYGENMESAVYYLNLLMDMKNCHIEKISDDFTNFLEMEYLDF